MSLCDKVPSDDVDGAHSGSRGLLLDPGQQRGVGGHHQVLQGLGRVCADVFQVHRQVNSSHKEAAWNTKQPVSAHCKENAFTLLLQRDAYPACPAFFCVRRPRSESPLCICWPTSTECAATDRHDNWRRCVHRTLSPSGRRTTGFEELTLPEISTATIRGSEEHHFVSFKTKNQHLPVILSLHACNMNLTSGLAAFMTKSGSMFHAQFP